MKREHRLNTTLNRVCCENFKKASGFDLFDWAIDKSGRVQKYFIYDFQVENAVALHFCPWCLVRLPLKEANGKKSQ